MSYFQREAAERKRRIAAARTWTETAGREDQGFSEWYSDSGQDLSGVSYADAYEAWLTSPARIEWWAERQRIYVGRGFARWYLAEGRTDSYAEAYEVYRALLHAEIAADQERRAER